MSTGHNDHVKSSFFWKECLLISSKIEIRDWINNRGFLVTMEY